MRSARATTSGSSVVDHFAGAAGRGALQGLFGRAQVARTVVDEGDFWHGYAVA